MELKVKSYGSIYGEDKGTGYAGNVWDKEQLCPSLTTSQGGNRQPMIVEEPKLKVINIPQTVKVRVFEVDIAYLQKSLRDNKKVLKISNKELAEKLNIPLTQVEHYFRTDKYFNIPDPEIWPQLSKILKINDTELDKSIMTYEEKEGVFEKSERHYLDSGLSPTILAGVNDKIVVAMRGRNPDNPSDRRSGIETEQRLEPNQEGICNSLTTVQKDNLVMEKVKAIDEQNMCIRNDTFGTIQTDGSSPKHNNRVLIKQATKQGYAECKIGGVADLSYPDSTTRRGRVQEGGDVSPALTVTDLGGISRIESKYRIRKLTPLECWRLMGFTDEEFKAAEAVNSNTQLYKQAGNSIVVDVLVGIFRNIIESMEVDDMRTKDALVEVVEIDKMIDLVKFREAEPELFEELVADYPGTKGNYLFCVGE